MKTFRAAFSGGFRAALRASVVAPLYLCLLLLGLIQTWPLLGADLRNPWLGDLAAGNPDTIVNLFLNNANAGSRAAGWSFLLAPLAIMSALAYAFCAGGMLSSYTATRSFRQGCVRFFWSFVGLNAIIFVLALVIGALAVGIGVVGGGSAGLIVAGIGLALLNVIGEYARAIGVVRDRRNPFVLLGQALVFSVQHLAGVLGLALAALGLYALLIAAYGVIAQEIGATPLMIFVQQAVVFGMVWLKGLRLAWAARYVAADNRPQRGAAVPLEPATSVARPALDQG